jgi:hypothetical protein
MLCKRKVYKTKVLQKRTRLLDVAEMKRITDGMDAEAKNFEGLKGAKNIYSKGKGWIWLSRRNKRALAWLMLFSSVASRGTAQSFVGATIYGDFVDDAAGNRFPV